MGKGSDIHDSNVDLSTPIQKAVAYISETWWTTNEKLVDKWVHSFAIHISNF